MELLEYQRKAMRTRNDLGCMEEDLVYGALKLSGEAGEVAELVGKYFGQGHTLNPEVIDELGDVLWYVAHLADTLGVSLDYVASQNIKKLQDRYPDGFDAEISRRRYEHE